MLEIQALLKACEECPITPARMGLNSVEDTIKELADRIRGTLAPPVDTPRRIEERTMRATARASIAAIAQLSKQRLSRGRAQSTWNSPDESIPAGQGKTL
jgi:hypothetical protein